MNFFQKLNKWWNDGSLFGYRPGYIILHPIKFYWEIAYRIKWAWQRVFRGWDDRCSWSVDFWLARTLPQILRKLKKDNIGIPLTMFEEEDWDKENYQYKEDAEEKAKAKWDTILDEIIEGFESYSEKDKVFWSNPKREQLEKILQDKFDRGFDLFRKYFSNLWD